MEIRPSPPSIPLKQRKKRGVGPIGPRPVCSCFRSAAAAAVVAATAIVAVAAAAHVAAAAAAQNDDQKDDPQAAAAPTIVISTTHYVLTSLDLRERRSRDSVLFYGSPPSLVTKKRGSSVRS